MGNHEFIFGRGKISAYLALFLSITAFGGVICFYFPNIFSTPQLRGLYPIDLFRNLINLFLILSTIFVAISLALGHSKKIALISMSLTIISFIMGAGNVPIEGELKQKINLNLDWLILDILLLAILFIPLEKIFPLKSNQKIFRPDFKLDFTYFLQNHLFFQAILLITSMPANFLENKFGKWNLQSLIVPLPEWVQFILIFLIVDLVQYWVHRCFHQIPWLWNFHAIHHSVDEMDWLAGSRLHAIDILLTRALIFIPFHLAGFNDSIIQIYVVVAALQTVYIHSNTRWKLNFLEFFLTTAKYHHWHHSSEKPAIDKNFAVHLPILDKIFGTYYCPKEKWPSKYGLNNQLIPKSYLKQFIYPFIKKDKK